MYGTYRTYNIKKSYERDGYEIDVHVNYNIVDREMYGTYNIKKSYERDCARGWRLKGLS